MKKKLAIFLACSLVLSSLAGCGNDTQQHPASNKDNPIALTLWHYYNGAQKSALDKMVLQFNETVGMEQGIIVQAHNKGEPNQLAECVLDSVHGKVGSAPVPHMFLGYADAVYTLDQLDRVANLDDYLTTEELDAYMPTYIQEGRMGLENSLKIFPTAKSTELLTINLTDWEPFANATGHTLEELAVLEQVVVLSEEYYTWTDAQTPQIPNDGKAFFGRDALANYMIIGSRQLGAEIFHVENNQVTFQTEETIMRRLWDNYYVPMVNGWFSAKGRYRSDDAKVGEILAQVGSTASCFYFPVEVTLGSENPYPITAATRPAPIFAGGEAYVVQQGAGAAVLTSTPEEESASVEFLKWITMAERNVDFSLSSGYLPVMKEGNQIENLEAALAQAQADGREYSSILEETLRTAYATVEDGLFYTNRAFKNGTQARNLLGTLLESYTQEDLAKVEQLVNSGMNHKAAVATVATDARFEQWLEELRLQLEATQKG